MPLVACKTFIIAERIPLAHSAVCISPFVHLLSAHQFPSIERVRVTFCFAHHLHSGSCVMTWCAQIFSSLKPRQIFYWQFLLCASCKSQSYKSNEFFLWTVCRSDLESIFSIWGVCNFGVAPLGESLLIYWWVNVLVPRGSRVIYLFINDSDLKQNRSGCRSSPATLPFPVQFQLQVICAAKIYWIGAQ